MEAPESRRESSSNTYHGIEVRDPYQWLEDWSLPEVKTWSAEQNSYARSVLDELPGWEAVSQRVIDTSSTDTVGYSSGQRLGNKAWFIKYAPPKQQRFLVEIDLSANSLQQRVVFDPESFDETGSTSIQWYKVSPDGNLLAVALTQGRGRSS